MMPTAAAATSVMQSMGYGTGDLQYLYKAAELQGQANSPAQFKAAIDGYIRGMQVQGKLINPNAIFELATMSKQYGFHFDDAYRNATLLSLVAEQGGAITGTQNATFMGAMGGAGLARGGHSAIKNLISLGLLNDSDVTKDKKGDPSGLKVGHQIKGYDEAVKNPFSWFKDTLLPAMTAHGVDVNDKSAVDKELEGLFHDKNARALLSKFNNQKEAFEAHEKLYPLTQGLDAIKSYEFVVSTAITALTTQFHDLAGVFTLPIMSDLGKGLTGFAKTVAGWKSEYQAWAVVHVQQAKELAASLLPLATAAFGAFSRMAMVALRSAITGTAMTGVGGLLGGIGRMLFGLPGLILAGAYTYFTLPPETRAKITAAARKMLSDAADAFNSAVEALRPQLVAAGASIKTAILEALGEMWRGLVNQVRSMFHLAPIHEPGASGGGEPAHDVFQRMRGADTSSTSILPNNFARFSIPGSAIAGQPQKPVDVHVAGDVKGAVEIMNRVVVNPSPLLMSIVGEAQKATAQIGGRLGMTASADNGVAPSSSASSLPIFAR